MLYYLRNQAVRFFYQILLIVAYWLSCTHIASAEIQNIQFQNISVQHGLSHSVVNDIAQDKQGFLWFATLNGLNRYDGYEFKHYFASGLNSLPNNIVYKLFYDSQQRLWVGTESGLAIYHTDSDDFELIDAAKGLVGDSIWHITEDSNGTIWVTTSESISYLNKDKSHFKALTKVDGDSLRDVRTIYETPDQQLIFGSPYSGLYSINESNKLESFKLENIDPQSIYASLQIENEVWFSTEQGLFRYNLTTQQTTKQTFPQINDAVTIINLTFDGTNVWLGTEQGLVIYDLFSESSRLVTQYSDYPNSIKSNIVLNSFIDSSGSVWIGTFNGGLSKYNEEIAQFKHYQAIPDSHLGLSDNMISSFSEDLEGNIWIATQSRGLNKYDPKKGAFKQYIADFNANIWNVIALENGMIWLTTNLGIYIFDPGSEKLRYLDLQADIDQILYAIQHKNKLWIGTEGGLITYKIESGIVSKIDDADELSNGPSIPIFVDDQERIWTVVPEQSGHKIRLFNTTTRQVEFFPELAEDFLVSDINETQDAYWLGSQYQGLFRFDKESKEIKNFTTDDGLSHNFVTAIEVVDNSLWVSTLKGLNHLNLKSQEIRSYLHHFGLDGNEFNERASIKSRDGLIVFGGNNGINVLNNNVNIKSEAFFSHPPILTKLAIANKEVSIAREGESAKLTKNIATAPAVLLSHSDTPFTISFSQPNANNAQQVEYRYKLEGFIDNWVEASANERRGFFANVPFGEYLFKVQARHPNKPWSNESTQLAVKIQPPLWLSPGALIAYLILASLFCFHLFGQYKNRKLSQVKLAESEERLSLALWGSGDEMWDWDIEQGTIVYSNSWENVRFSTSKKNISSAPDHHAYVHPNDLERVKNAQKIHLDKKTKHYEATYRIRDIDGEWLWVLDRGKVVEFCADDSPARMTGTLKNISKIKKAEGRLNLLAQSISNISDGMFILDGHFNIIEINAAYSEITGENKQQAIGKGLTFLNYGEQFLQQIKRSLFATGRWAGEVKAYRQGDGDYFIELNIDAMKSDDDEIEHFVGVFSDITYRKRAEKELRELANIDILTKLPNRSFFQASHRNLVQRQAPHALLVLDLDDFKKVNDSQGHLVGDELIKQASSRLQQELPKDYTLFRLGGDEFAVIIEHDEDLVTVTQRCQKLLNTMATPFRINSQEYAVTCSIGIASYPIDGDSSDVLLKNADTAMYFAKDKGGNHYQFFSESMNQDAVKRVQVENLIRYGLKEDLFSVFFQPKVDIQTGRLTGMESLVRFHHPDKGIVSPGQFIPLAEENGQIVEIGEIVLRKACFATKAWLDAGLFKGRVAVNLSTRQFALPDLCERINHVLELTGLPASNLELEITEGSLMESPKDAIEVMYRLRARGIHLALDDFGTGYSSLSYLKQFPINTLKIDKAFVDDIEHSEKDKKMAASIVAIAHNLDLSVVAEGVETESQLSILKQLDCETVQGYIYSKPLSEQKFSELLQNNQAVKQHIKVKI